MAHLRAGQELKCVQDASLAREKDKKIEIMQLMNLFKEIKIMLQRDWDDATDGPLEGRTGIPKHTHFARTWTWPKVSRLEPEVETFFSWCTWVRTFHLLFTWQMLYQLFRSTLYHDSPHWWDFEFVQPIILPLVGPDLKSRVWRIYTNIRIYWSRIYIWTFVRINFSFTNIFGHSFVSNLFVRIYSDIRWWVC